MNFNRKTTRSIYLKRAGLGFLTAPQGIVMPDYLPTANSSEVRIPIQAGGLGIS